MRIDKTVKKILATMLILSMVVVGMVNGTTEPVQAAVNQKELISNYLSSSVKYLYLGGQGVKTYDFNIRKEVREEGSTYSWYVKTDKGNPNSVTINKKTGIVTAKEAGTGYIRCKITLADGTILRPEAMVTVRNNITNVKIKNLPSNLSLPAGRAYDFNRTVLDTDAGKEVKTEGITGWEIVDDTAGVDAATTQGIVYPTKEGEFKIRAVCFQSTAKYNLWLANKEANGICITAASEWVTIKVASSNETAIAATQEQLNKLLKEDSITKITLLTEKALTFMIPEGNYSKKTLIVNAANADVQNHGIFKEVTINAIKDNTWIEFADGNIFYLNDKVVSLIIGKEVNVKRIVIDTPRCTVNFEILGTVGEIIVRQPSEVNITGGGAQVPVSVEETAAGSTITTSRPLNLDLKAKTNITLNQGAEETIIDKSDSKVVIKIENNTNKSNVITTNNSGGEAIGVGKTVISDGNDSTSNPATTTGPTTIDISGITVSGNAEVGAILTATATPGAATGSYQWTSSDTVDGTYTAILGATTSTFIIEVAYAGKFIKATITGTGSYKGTQTSAATGTIVKPLTITEPTLTLTKTYDGNTTAAVTTGTLNGVIGTDDVKVSAVATYNTATVGTGKTITIVYTLSGADAAKYVKPVNATVTNGVITVAPLTVTVPTLTLQKAYDGNTTVAVTQGTINGVIGTDDVTVSATAVYNSAAVGAGKTITVVYTLSGADAAKYLKPVNYTVATGEIKSTQLTISAPTLTISKAYDGNTSAAVTVGALLGVIGNDNVTVGAVANYNSEAVGTGKTITVVYTLSGADAAKYVKPVNYTVATGEITTAQITITTPALTTSKSYDGSITATVTAGTLNGVIGAEDVTVSAVASYNTAVVGTGKTITVVYALSGVDASKYTKPINYTVTTGEITAEPLTITTPTLTLTKEYDGTLTSTVTAGTLSGVNGTDEVTVSAVATYNTAEVGTDKTITVVYTLSGADATKYVKPANYTVSTGEITAAPLTVSTPTLIQTKAYDGNTTAEVTAGTLTGVVGNDVVTVNAVATYNLAAVGTSKTITVVYTLSGADAGNYVKPANYTVTTGTITTKQLTITTSGLTASKTYDGKTTAAVTAGTLTGVIGDEVVTVSAEATYNSPTVGSGKTITVVYTLSGADAVNYVKPANYTVATGTITATVLTITAPTVTTSKVYDGNTTTQVISGTLHGIIGSEDVIVSAVATYNTAILGTGKTITVVYTLGGADAANYVKPINETVSTGEITAEPLTITDPFLGLTKAYNGNTTATVTVGTLNGVNGTDDVTVTAVATYNTAAVGTGKIITVVYTLSGADAAKYVKPVNYTVATGAITAITLTASAPTVGLTKAYDGNTITTVTHGTLSGLIGADQVTLNAVATYGTAAVGTGKTITVVYTLSGAATGNYVKPVNYTVATGAITAAQLTIATPVLTTSKAYDNNTTATVTAGTLSGVITSEDVSVSAIATYNSATIGSGKTITVVYSLSGADAANYVKPANLTVATGTITAAQLTIIAPSLTTSKAYDGSTTAAVIPASLQGVVGSETVTVSAVATYNSATVGTGKTITVTYTLVGANAANYVKPANYTIATGEITAKQLTFSGFNLAMSKIYDGNVNATVTTTSGTLHGVIGADNVLVSAVATYNSATVGSGKTITISYTLSGTDAGKYVKPANYTMSMGIINAAPLTAAAPTVSLTKVYDGNITSASVTPGSLSGVIGTDQVLLSAIATYDTAAAGTGKTITVVYSLTGASAGNYATPANFAVATGAITAAQLTIVTTSLIASKAYDGNVTATVTPGTLSGVVNTDTVTVNAVATYASATVGTGKTITVVYSLIGANAANYVKPADYTVTGAITAVRLTITTPTITASKAYDGTTTATVTPGTLQGVVGSEDVTVNAVATYNTVAAGTYKAITVVYALSGTDAANYVQPVNDAVANGVITRVQLTITEPSVTTSKVYNGSSSAAVEPGTLQGVLGTENVIVSATAYYGTSNVGNNKQIFVYYEISGTDAANYYAPINNLVFIGSITTAQVELTSITANGTLGSETTTELNLYFASVPTALSVNDITVTGATKGTLTGNGTTRTLTISNIIVANGENITVEITSPTGYAITPASNNVPVNVKTKTTTVGGAQFTYIFNATGITLINYTGTNMEIIIGYLDEYKVTEIATNAIKNNSYLRKITIGTDTVNDSNVVVIKQYAIYGCGNLNTICLGMNVQARPSSVGPSTTLKTAASAYGDVMGFVQPGTYNLVGTVWTRFVSSDATLKASSTIKGIVVSIGASFNTFNDVSFDVITNIPSVNANDTTNSGGYITLFDPTSTAASVKAVRYLAAGSYTWMESEFDTLNAYENEPLANGDYFIIKVVAEDGTTRWYLIDLSVG